MRSNHVGPIIFGHPDARRHLMEEGEVYTFRTSDRTTGETWARESRTAPKLADVTVTKVCGIPAPREDDLNREWGRKSGFRTRERWWNAIEEVHGDGLAEGYVYHVQLRGEPA
jgi:hypothetical protein